MSTQDPAIIPPPFQQDADTKPSTTNPATTTPTPPNPTPEPILTLTRNISIRPATHSDAPQLSLYANNLKIARNMRTRWPSPYTRDSAHDWISFCRNKTNWPCYSTPPSNPHPPSFAITQSNAVIGMIGLQPQSDIHSHCAAVGYWLGEPFWGQGIATEVLIAFVKWLWITYPDLRRLQADVYSWNPASGKVLEKAGFVFEGRLRGSVMRFGEVGDLMVYGLLRGDK